MKKVEIIWVFSSDGRDKKCILDFGGETCLKAPFESLRKIMADNIKWISWKYVMRLVDK
jgi:hypothetical protein